jgi:hypothetical protein
MQNLFRFTIDKHTGPLSIMELAVAVRNLGSAKTLYTYTSDRPVTRRKLTFHGFVNMARL